MATTSSLTAGQSTASAQEVVRLSADLSAGEKVGLFRVLENGSVSYEAGFGWGGNNEAWHVAPGQAATRISDGTGRGRVNYATFSVASPDGAFVYFGMRPLEDPHSFYQDVYRTPVGGGAPEPVLEREPADAIDSINHHAIGFSPDQSELLYLSDFEQPGIKELYARSLSTGVTRRVTPPRPSNGSLDPGYVRITPDGLNVLFSTHFDGASHREVWSVPLVGGEAVQLNVGLPDVNYLPQRPFNASGNEVLFHTSVGVYRNSIDGGQPVLLSAPQRAGSLLVSPDGERIAYTQGSMIYGTPSGGGPVVQYPTSSSTSALFFTPDGTQLVLSDRGQTAIISVAATGGTPIGLTDGRHPSGTNYQFVQLTNTGGEMGVLYQTFPDTGIDRPKEIYHVNLNGTKHNRLNMPLAPTDAMETGRFSQTSDGEFVVFGIIESTRHSFNEAAYYMTPIEGGPIVRVTPELPAGASIKQFGLSPDGLRLFFTADSRTLGIDELFASGLPMDRLNVGAGVGAQVNGGLDLVGGVEATFEEVLTRGIFTASYTPGLIPLEFGAGPGAFHQWELDLTGQVTGDAALTFKYASSNLQAAGVEPAPTVYLKGPGGAWTSVDPTLVAFQPGQFTVNLGALDGVTIGLAVSSVPEPTSVLLIWMAAIGLAAVRRRAV